MRSFDFSPELNLLALLILHPSSHPLLLLPAKARVLTKAFGDTKAVLALAAVWPILMMMLLELILCETS